LKDLAKIVFHGSVIGSVLEGGRDLENFLTVAQSICVNLSVDEKLLEDIQKAYVA
jgi:hypothetical protein